MSKEIDNLPVSTKTKSAVGNDEKLHELRNDTIIRGGFEGNVLNESGLVINFT